MLKNGWITINFCFWYTLTSTVTLTQRIAWIHQRFIDGYIFVCILHLGYKASLCITAHTHS